MGLAGLHLLALPDPPLLANTLDDCSLPLPQNVDRCTRTREAVLPVEDLFDLRACWVRSHAMRRCTNTEIKYADPESSLFLLGSRALYSILITSAVENVGAERWDKAWFKLGRWPGFRIQPEKPYSTGQK